MDYVDSKLDEEEAALAEELVAVVGNLSTAVEEVQGVADRLGVKLGVRSDERMVGDGTERADGPGGSASRAGDERTVSRAVGGHYQHGTEDGSAARYEAADQGERRGRSPSGEGTGSPLPVGARSSAPAAHEHRNPSPSQEVGAWCNDGCGQFVPLSRFPQEPSQFYPDGPRSYFVDARDYAGSDRCFHLAGHDSQGLCRDCAAQIEDEVVAEIHSAARSDATEAVCCCTAFVDFDDRCAPCARGLHDECHKIPHEAATDVPAECTQRQPGRRCKEASDGRCLYCSRRMSYPDESGEAARKVATGQWEMPDLLQQAREWFRTEDEARAYMKGREEEYANASTDQLRRHPNAKLWSCPCGRWYSDAGSGSEPKCPYCNPEAFTSAVEASANRCPTCGTACIYCVRVKGVDVTGAERYFADRMNDPEYAAAYHEARDRERAGSAAGQSSDSSPPRESVAGDAPPDSATYPGADDIEDDVLYDLNAVRRTWANGAPWGGMQQAKDTIRLLCDEVERFRSAGSAGTPSVGRLVRLVRAYFDIAFRPHAPAELAHTRKLMHKALTDYESGCTCEPVGPDMHDSTCALVTSGVVSQEHADD